VSNLQTEGAAMTNLTNLKRWTAALRDGTRQQGEGYLRELIDGIPHYCCLGVACEVFGIESRQTLNGSTLTEYGAFGNETMPPSEFRKILGLSNDTVDGEDVFLDAGDVTYCSDDQDPDTELDLCDIGLAEINDDWGLSFEQIADLIDYFGVR
jgi:hypothetical protein